jgi:murein DD-endopeptidase MepM/ murein hydrolase activator NlpD
MTPGRSRAPLSHQAPRVTLLLFTLGLFTGGCSIPRWPVEGPLISPFGIRFQGVKPDLHRGVDISVSDGTEVRSMARGRVRFAGTMRGYGNVIWLDHRGGVMTVYGHLSSIQVSTGSEVRGGQVIALSGHSGNASGPHLHFEIWRHGREVDPVPLLGGFPGRGG